MNNSEDFYIRLEEQLSNSFKWPNKYRFKFILKSNEKDIQELKSIFNDINGALFSLRKSSNNKFTSVSINAVMKNPISIINKYKLASKIEGIISL